MQPKLVVQQKINAFTNQYRVYSPDEAGEKANLLAFAQQKRLAFKEKVTFYSDENKQTTAFTFRAEKVMDIHGKFLVEDVAGKMVGAFRKNFKESLIKSTWTLLDESDQPKFVITESNLALALLRRFADFIPLVGGILDLLTAFLKYHFTITDVATGQIVGKYQKTTLFRDHYLLSADESYNNYDWRAWAAIAVAMDALQGR